jgi:proteasome lid subunit RPN8/RPN11
MTEFKEAYEQARRHARDLYPEEACGFIVKGEYVPVKNVASDPKSHVDDPDACTCRKCCFRVAKKDVAKYLPDADMFLHSHPDGPLYPSRTDMQSQISMGIPWGIIALDEERIGQPEIWGDTLPIQPLVGRTFLHGIRDCYSLIRDVYRLGRERLALDDITREWPFDPIYLADKPRDHAWWEMDLDYYETEPGKWGFVPIAQHEAQPGDVFLASIRANGKINHGGVLLSNDLILHHLPQRVSRREPAGIWARHAAKWVRYVGEGSIHAV